MFSTARDDLNLKQKILQIAVLLRLQSLLKKEPKVFLVANFGGFVTEKRNCEIHVKKTFSFFSKRDWHCKRIAICSTPNQPKSKIKRLYFDTQRYNFTSLFFRTSKLKSS